MFNFEQYKYITYSERERKGGGEEEERERNETRRKKNQESSMSPSCFQKAPSAFSI